MALYDVTNTSAGTIVLPPPLGKRLDKYETFRVSAPAGITESNFNRKYSALVRMAQTGLISVRTVEDPSVDDNIEVATVSMLRAQTGAADTFDALFTGILNYGDLVYVKPDNSVALVDVTDFDKLPAIGVVVATLGPVATVQTDGLVSGLVGLVPGRQHFVGLTGAPVYPPPWPTPGNTLFHQIVGIAKSSTSLQIDSIGVMTKVR